jgi:hypothetical protein
MLSPSRKAAILHKLAELAMPPPGAPAGRSGMKYVADPTDLQRRSDANRAEGGNGLGLAAGPAASKKILGASLGAPMGGQSANTTIPGVR